MKIALIAGATGLTGKSLLYALLDTKEYVRIFILVRRELAIKDSRLTQITFDYDNPDHYDNLPVADDIFCCLGTTIAKAGSQEAFRKVDLDYPVRLAEACSHKGYKKFLIITALGADQNSRFFYNKIKGEAENKIKTTAFDSIYFCRPSLILGNRPKIRIGEEIGKVLAKFTSLLLFGPLKKYKAIQASTIAKAMIVLAGQTNPGIHTIESDKLSELGKK